MGRNKKKVTTETLEYIKKRRLEGTNYKVIAKETKANDNLTTLSDWAIRSRLKGVKIEHVEPEEVKPEIKPEPEPEPEQVKEAENKTVVKQGEPTYLKLDIADDINKTDPLKMKAWAENIEIIGNTLVKILPVAGALMTMLQKRAETNKTIEPTPKAKFDIKDLEGRKGLF